MPPWQRRGAQSLDNADDRRRGLHGVLRTGLVQTVEHAEAFDDGDDWEGAEARIAGEDEEVLVARNKMVGLASEGGSEDLLVFGIANRDGYRGGWPDAGVVVTSLRSGAIRSALKPSSSTILGRWKTSTNASSCSSERTREKAPLLTASNSAWEFPRAEIVPLTKTFVSTVAPGRFAALAHSALGAPPRPPGSRTRTPHRGPCRRCARGSARLPARIAPWRRAFPCP